ncbi:MAG TPA: serine hydrolase [Thermoanaerobaculia bacterium]|nr:serine hydrolase [Thermoanaerobaculia bacterium]
MTSLPSRANVFARCALLLLAAALLAAPARAAVSTTSDDDIVRYADQLFSQTYPAGEPGAAVLVARGGKVLLRKGYGMANLELGVPIQPDMVFELGSVTKQFTAAAILLLQERGKLSVADDITKYLPDFPTHGQKITLDNLLTHVSGVTNYTDLPEWRTRVREDMTVEQLIGLFKDKPLDFNPGEKWSYSNSAYILLGAVIEKVSGKSYEDFVEQEIFAPLGMKHSSYGHQTEVVPGRVSGYDKSDTGYKIAEYLSMTQPYSAGSLLSNVDDLALWVDALSSEKLLKKTSLAQMATPAKLASGVSTKYAYGQGISEADGPEIIEHSGGIFGFTTDLLRIPDQRLLIVVLSNNPAQEPSPETLAYRVALKALGKPWEDRKAIALDPATLDDYLGVYRVDPQTTRMITREGDKLFAQRSGGDKHEIRATSRDDFFYTDVDNRIHFRRDAQGKITGMDFLNRYGPDATATKTDEPPPAERQAVQVDPGLYDGYTGVYELFPGLQLTLTREGDHLMVQGTGQPKIEIFPESETRFFLKVVDAEIELQRGPDGKATGLTLFQGGKTIPGKKVK